MASGALRGVLTAWLSLIALQAVGSSGGSGRVGDAFRDLNGIVGRVLDPAVPAIPDRRAGATTGTATSTTPASRTKTPLPAPARTPARIPKPATPF